MSSPQPDVISAAELDQIARDMNATEELFLDAQRTTVQTVSCPECGGSGAGDHGSLGGAACWQCHGTGTVTDEFSDKKPMELPDRFVALRFEYKRVRGLLDSHVASKAASEAGVAAGLPPTKVAPAPTRKDAAALATAAKTLDEINEEIRGAVRQHRKDHAAELSSGRDEEVADLKRRLAALEKGRLGSGAKKRTRPVEPADEDLGAGPSDEELDNL